MPILAGGKSGRTSAPRLPHAEQMNLGSRSDSRTSSAHRSPLIATWWLTRQKYRTHRKSGRKSPFCCPLWPDIPLKNPRGRLSQGGSHHGIHQLHSDQHASARIEPAPVTGNDLASVEGRHTETHNHRSACARTGLAASRRSSLVVQKIYRGGSGLAIIDRAQVCAVPNACLSDRG